MAPGTAAFLIPNPPPSSDEYCKLVHSSFFLPPVYPPQRATIRATWSNHPGDTQVPTVGSTDPLSIPTHSSQRLWLLLITPTHIIRKMCQREERPNGERESGHHQLYSLALPSSATLPGIQASKCPGVATPSAPSHFVNPTGPNQNRHRSHQKAWTGPVHQVHAKTLVATPAQGFGSPTHVRRRMLEFSAEFNRKPMHWQTRARLYRRGTS